ncbi:Spx/MgsR family RNA polymerase-binding regulatory protein [Parapusillimonas granuli]|uniref:Spx/MgsR family RNA polymerase-binding regulatory protein n=1 Tax=Parapusillimonas granuli TaxID=380911 RepID=A0A853GA96_9BURK|nr:Spx/MgsR family RNA polymerase-binding regulatory protein [Parapusillimonas granuli]MBB5216887.1 Spx/MgsR family transcriptional regulator [Parapusillimonas granuli]MEB2401532.1 Spx/MgsR family RNA polymerase-binding regulatory protein [Alcaligenaceae bacterium]NYT51686.1 Spx/MgsR family RNA polymerase-binding regulatory protein [Parapusillimonas granuli]
MQTLRLYGLKKCSTCVKAMDWLEHNGVPFTFTDYRDHPVPPDSLRAWADALGGWEKLVNRASMTWRNLPDVRKSPATPEQWLDLIAEFPALVRRPVAVDAEGGVGVGFSEKRFGERFAK